MQRAGANGGGGAAASINAGGAAEMGSEVLEVMMAAATSLDFFDAVAM